jgi:hypothetical protein
MDEPRYDEMRPGDEAPPGQEGTGEDFCPDCSGSGKRDGADCETCVGTGRVEAGIGGGRRVAWVTVVCGSEARAQPARSGSIARSERLAA